MERIGTVVILAAMLWGCDGSGSVDVVGSVGSGGQLTSGTSGNVSGGTGGNTATEARRARLSRVEADGSVTVVAEGEVDEDGAYHLQAPPHQERLVVEALDGSGEVIGRAILASTGEAGGEVVVAPLDAETSLEARLLVELTGRLGPERVDPCDLRSRVDARLAAAVEAAGDRGDAVVDGLVDGIAAAQQAEARAWADLGVQATQDDAFHAELEAAATLDAALSGGEDAARAEAAFVADLTRAALDLGLRAEDEAEAEAQATVALDLATSATLDAEPAVEAALLASGRVEARATGDAIAASLAAANATDEVRARAETAADELQAEVSAAETVDAAADAFATFDAELVGDEDVRGSLLAEHAGLDVVTSADAELAVRASEDAAATFDATVAGAADQALDASGRVDPAILADAIVRARAAYRSAVRAAVTGSGVLDGDASLTLVTTASGSFRVR